ncbi:MAG TPA: LemA family protein [Bryobacteraceae bacterium]|nr:LemA family protein [Bryobacteraceae bacterium]
MKYVALVLVAVALVCGAKCVTIRKDLVSERQAIDADWAQVDAALAHRAAMLPDLTNTVQAEAPADAAAIRTVAIPAVNDARTALSAAHSQHEKIKANARLDEAVARLMLEAENYPKIERSKEYGGLLEALKGAEYQIAVARRKYNEAVEHYNARIDLFPSNIVASLTRLGKIDAYFQTPAI